MDSCKHDRVLRLQVPDRGDYWICSVCNAQFVEKSLVNWRMAYLATELGRLLSEQAERVREEEGLLTSE